MALAGVSVEIGSLKVKRSSRLGVAVDGDSESLEMFERDRFCVASLHICSESTQAIVGGVDRRQRLLGWAIAGID